MMADLNTTRKELVLAYDFTQKGVAEASKIGGVKVKEIVAKR